MLSSPTRNSGNGDERGSGGAVAGGTDSLAFRTDYYGGDFVEDGSFLVLNTDGMSLSPVTPPEERSDGEDNIEVINMGANNEDETPTASLYKSLTQSQVLGEDPESSVESRHSLTKDEEKHSLPNVATQSSGNPGSMSIVSVSSGSTDTHLLESSEEVNLLMAENKKLAELLTGSIEKMKECIEATEKLKADHEDYKRKNEASREVISRLRHENEMLQSQVSMIQSETDNSNEVTQHEDTMDTTESISKDETISKHLHTISELNERLETVLTVNGQLNDKLDDGQKTTDDLRAELEVMKKEKEEGRQKVEVMRAEIDHGRAVILKFKQYQEKHETELQAATAKVRSLEEVIQEKTILTENLRRDMENNLAAMDTSNRKLNLKEKEISLLRTQLAAIRAETESNDRLQVLEMQCQTYSTDFRKLEEERAKLAAEKDTLLNELNAVSQELREKTDALDLLQNTGRQSHGEFVSRNDNSAANANESLSSPLASLPSSVAGQFVGFVRRELLGWEDHSGAAADSNVAASGGAESDAVVQQPKQDTVPPCPICRKNFTSLEKLQRHASTCGIEYMGNPDDPFVFP